MSIRPHRPRSVNSVVLDSVAARPAWVVCLVAQAWLLLGAPAAVAQPANDDYSDPEVLSVGVTPFSTLGATNDGPLACAPLGADIWFTYTAPGSGTTTIRTCGEANFDTVLVVYYGAGSLGPVVACDDNACGPHSQVSFPATAGASFTLRVGGAGGAWGSGQITVILSGGGAPANDNCSDFIPAGPGTHPIVTIGATTDGPPEPGCNFPVDPQIHSDVWFMYVPNCNADVLMQVMADFGGRIAVYDGFGCPPAGPPNLCTAEDFSVAPSEWGFLAVRGHPYLIRIGGRFEGDQGQGQLEILENCQPPPSAGPSCCSQTTRNGDWDGDCDVDLIDYSAFQICAGRHSSRGASTCLNDGCTFLDIAEDGLVNLTDWNSFVDAITGPMPSLGGCDPNRGSCDAWATGDNPGLGFGGTYYVFGDPPNPPADYDFDSNGNPPLPAGFFANEPDSRPFHGVVPLGGQPIDILSSAGSDTIIEHPPLRFGFGDLPLCDIVPARLQSLSLRSRDPIVVRRSVDPNDCNGNGIPDSTDIAGSTSVDLNNNGVPDECEWYVAVEPSQLSPPDGFIEACKTYDNGGTYDATVYVQPLFVFVNKAELDSGVPATTDNVKILDTGIAGLSPIIFEFTDQPFVICPSDNGTYHTPCSEGHFVPGIAGSARGSEESVRQATTCASHLKPGHAHYFCPPQCFEHRCTYNAVGGPFGVCLPIGCGAPTCPAFPALHMPGPQCLGPSPAPCPQVAFFLIGLGPCPGGCAFPQGRCVQFYGGAGAGAITCTPTGRLLCP